MKNLAALHAIQRGDLKAALLAYDDAILDLILTCLIEQERDAKATNPADYQWAHNPDHVAKEHDPFRHVKVNLDLSLLEGR